jgi:hypothetical protein
VYREILSTRKGRSNGDTGAAFRMGCHIDLRGRRFNEGIPWGQYSMEMTFASGEPYRHFAGDALSARAIPRRMLDGHFQDATFWFQGFVSDAASLPVA